MPRSRLADCCHGLCQRAPLWLAFAFVAAFALWPLGQLAVDTVLGPDGPTLAAWRAFGADEHDGERLLASLRLGAVATAIAAVLGGGHAWVTFGTDAPGARWLGPLAAAPLAMPPIFVAMGFADLGLATGFWPCALLLGLANAPFVAVLTARGLRASDGRAFEAAWQLRGRARAERLLLRSVLPELAAGCLLAFVFTVADHGVPEFLTVKGKTWHTWAEGVFGRWSRRATATSFVDLQSPITAALPFLAALVVLLWFALRLRAHAPDRGTPQPLPPRPLGAWRLPALAVPLLWLGAGLGVPLFVFTRWMLGSAQRAQPMSLAFARQSFHKAMDQGAVDLGHSLALAAAVAAAVLLLALPLARASRRRRWPELLAALPVAAPAILLGIALVHTWHDAALLRLGGGDVYGSWAFAIAGYTARLLPFAVLPLGAQVRRLPPSGEDAAVLLPRSAWARALRIHLPPLLPACWSAGLLVFVLALRELDLAVLLPAANGTAVRRLANAVHFQHEDWSAVIALLLLLAAALAALVPVLLSGRRPPALS